MPQLPSAATPFISLSLWVERRQDPRGQRHCPCRGQLVTSVSFVLQSSLSAWGRASLLKSVKVDLTRGLLPLWLEGRAELLAGENRVEKHELWVSGPGVRFRCLCAPPTFLLVLGKATFLSKPERQLAGKLPSLGSRLLGSG